MIDGVKIINLRKIPDERGTIMHMLKKTDPHFQKFGEIYFSKIYPDVIKAWHIHKKITLNYSVIVGNIKLVLYDLRHMSKTSGELMEIFIGEDNYSLVIIPPGIANGFKCIGKTPAIVANCATEPHTKNEIKRMDPFNNNIPYDWNLKHG